MSEFELDEINVQFENPDKILKDLKKSFEKKGFQVKTKTIENIIIFKK